MFENGIAKCEQGRLRGREIGCATAFLGVPFAQPPVGELRWREPRECPPWRGIREAGYFRASPLQTVSGADSGEETAHLSEDCLYLNVWTPARSADERLPVLLWYYGGGFQTGRADDPAYDGRETAKRGVILVTANYRLGVLGFLCHPDMRRESPYGMGGNFGLLDQIAALEWVKRNIASFGGDPDRITVEGQSAGSMSVANIMVSPLSRGLIAGAVMQSGDPFLPGRAVPFAEAAETGARLCEKMGARSLDEMRAMPADRFISLGSDAMRREMGSFCAPVVDGRVIPAFQGAMLLRGDCANVPLLTGTAADEGFARGDGFIRDTCGMLGIDPSPYEKAPGGAQALGRGFFYARHCAFTRIRAERYGAGVWHYRFSCPDGERGAHHCAEVPYQFGTLDNSVTYTRSTPVRKEDRALSEKVCGIWANFAKRGDPNGDGIPYWPDKAKEPFSHMELNYRMGMEPDAAREGDKELIEAVYAWMLRIADGKDA